MGDQRIVLLGIENKTLLVSLREQEEKLEAALVSVREGMRAALFVSHDIEQLRLREKEIEVLETEVKDQNSKRLKVGGNDGKG